MAQSDAEKLQKKHANLIHAEECKVISHQQRDCKTDDWVIHTLMIESWDVPFKFKRKGHYQNLKGARVNLTYYPNVETVAGLEFETMAVVRIKRS